MIHVHALCLIAVAALIHIVYAICCIATPKQVTTWPCTGSNNVVVFIILGSVPVCCKACLSPVAEVAFLHLHGLGELLIVPFLSSACSVIPLSMVVWVGQLLCISSNHVQGEFLVPPLHRKMEMCPTSLALLFEASLSNFRILAFWVVLDYACCMLMHLCLCWSP
jgi:hypothetical protein